MASSHQDPLAADSNTTAVEVDRLSRSAPSCETGPFNMSEEHTLTVDNNEDEVIIEVSMQELLSILCQQYRQFIISRSSTASISSSLYEHVEEHGRTYHKYKQGKYFVPNDELEQNRLDMQHQICKMTLHGRLHLAPLNEANLKHVLDFGTGTGIWAIEFAQQYPKAQVIGSDLSPIQPELVPPNLTFEIDDMDDEWVWSNPFSYVHGRLMALCFIDPQAVFMKAFAALEPGGYFEMQEGAPLRSIDGSTEGTTLQRICDLIVEAAAKRGADLNSGKRYKKMFEDVGFENVEEVVFEWPIGTWAKSEYHKRIGAWFQKDMTMGIEGFATMALTKILGMNKEEVDELIEGAKEDMNNKNIHGYQPFYVVYGRKPLKRVDPVAE